VSVYRLRNTGPRLQNFRVKAPYIEVAGIKIDCAIRPSIKNVIAGGSEYANIELQRCLEIDVDCVLHELNDAGTPGDEYGLVVSSCTGGQIRGSYYSERHGIAFGNTDIACCVPNRSVKVYADTYNVRSTGSLDFGHGCSENLQAIGGTHHGGVVVGGKNAKFTGCRIRKGLASGGEQGGICIYGAEIYGGTFEFDSCYIEQRAAAGASFSAITLLVQAAAVENVNFIFRDNTYEIGSSDTIAARISTTSAPVNVSVEVEDPTIIGGGSLANFYRLQNNAGTFTCQRLSCRGVKGLGAAVPRVTTVGSVTINEAHMDPQSGSAAQVAGSTGANSVNQAVSFGWAYPAGVVPLVKCQLNGSNIGGKRAICFANSISNTGFQITAMTADAANFSSTSSGNVLWEATVD